MSDGNIYGYVYSKKAIFKHNIAQHKTDSFFTKPLEIITRIEIDTSTHTFYFFDGPGKVITRYQPATGAVYANSLPTDQATYLKVKFDTIKQVSQLQLRHFKDPASDTTLYEFPQFKDGGLSADGFYVRDIISHNQFYIPFYNGDIIRYNEPENSIHLLQTIDKTPAANIAVKTGNIYSRSSKAVMVNSTATTDQQYLYVLSYVLSDDSDYKGPAVDVYDISTGKYTSSFRLPSFEGKPVLQLAKQADTLVAAYENNILIFKLTAK